MDPLDAVRLAAGGAVLGLAALHDWRTRRVPDGLWVGLGGIAVVLLLVELLRDGAPLVAQLILLPVAVLFFGVFVGPPLFDEGGFRPRPLRLGAYAGAYVVLAASVLQGLREGVLGVQAPLLLVVVLIAVAHAFYYVGLLRGGADAKAFMTVAVLVPTYPDLGPLPLLQFPEAVAAVLSLGFPFAFVVLLNAALLLVVLPVAFLVRNALRGDLSFPQCLLGYRVPLDRVPAFTWLMEGVEGDAVVRGVLPRWEEERDARLEALRARGRRTVWVTPKLPFLVPFLVGYVVAFVVGNLFYGLLTSLS